MANRIGSTVAARFGREASAYREHLAPLLEPAGRRLLAELTSSSQPVLARPWVVDLGTGVGTLAAHIRTRVPQARVLGLDRAPGMLALTPSSLETAAMDGARLGLASDSVDLMLAVFVLFFLDDPLAGLREAKRVLRPGSQLGTATWGSTLDCPAMRVWAGCLAELDPDPPEPEPWNLEALDSAPKVTRLLETAGFTGVRAFEEELTTTVGPESLLRMKTSVGRDKHLFDALDAEGQAACVALARHRMAQLEARDFLARATVVYALGVAE